MNNNNLVDDSSESEVLASSQHQHLIKSDRIKSASVTAASAIINAAPFEHDLATVGHEINRYTNAATRPYLSQLRAKCEKQKFEKEHPANKLEEAKDDTMTTNKKSEKNHHRPTESTKISNDNNEQADGLQYRL